MNQMNYFPVTWRHPADADLFWSQDRLHYPDPVTPLEFSFIEGAVDAGLGKALRHYDIPLSLLNRHINSYAYFCVLPDALTDDVAAALAAQLILMRSGRVLRAGPLAEVWNDADLSAAYGVPLRTRQLDGKRLLLWDD